MALVAPFADPTDPAVGSTVNEAGGAKYEDGRNQWDFSWAQQATLRLALAEVPKSGEVWCEGARMHLNPLARTFDLVIAQRYVLGREQSEPPATQHPTSPTSPTTHPPT